MIDEDNYKGAEWKLIHIEGDKRYLCIAKNRIAMIYGNKHFTNYDRIGNKDTWVIPDEEIAIHYEIA